MDNSRLHGSSGHRSVAASGAHEWVYGRRRGQRPGKRHRVGDSTAQFASPVRTMAHHHENNDSPEDAMNDFKPFVLIERTISEIRQAHWPFKGSWKKSRKRGIKVAKRQRWVQKARQLLPMKP